MFHDSMYCGTHAGCDKTINNLKGALYFKDMTKYVEMYIKTCNTCQRVKDRKSKPFSPLGDIEADYPFSLY